jgi:predicted GNAT family N-acyltransferase
MVVPRADRQRRSPAAGGAVFGLVDEREDLVGFTRVLSDGVYVALVLDVVVRADSRRHGYGRSLLAAVLADPRFTGVRSIELVCQPDLVAFYARFGFTDRVGRSRLMRRTSDPVLTGPPAGTDGP